MPSTVIPYSPRRLFVPYHFRKQRWAVIVAHRRFGKTVGVINDLIKRAIENERVFPPPRYAYVAPYLAQAKEIAWGYLNHYGAPAIVEKNESELWVQLVNGARIRIHGADNPDRLRGSYLDGVVPDEYADFRPGVFEEVIRPMLADYQGWATFLGTPKGRNRFYEVWTNAQGDPEWFSAMFRASETGIIPPEELEALRDESVPEVYAQEFECSFDAAVVGTYFGRGMEDAAREGRITSVEVDPLLPVHTAWDLGVGDATAIWFFQVVGNEVRAVDFYQSQGRGLDHYVCELRARGYRYGLDYVPHDARVRELGTGRSRVETLVSLGRKPTLAPAAKLMDGINAARLTLPRVWFDETRCHEGIEALRQYRADFDKRTKTFKDTPRHDEFSHAADAFRYLCLAWREQAKPQPEKPQFDASRPAGAQVTVNDFLGLRKRREERV